ncbi:helix-turn-helix transcriptional regulator [Aurantimonas sp. A2-1-M11]|uniref:helix-turn-helix domain-containing protein n=1 Tax=Aurantimonas sp. A2-1-M11 TaxID=3113712 RepID=UPI002F95677C
MSHLTLSEWRSESGKSLAETAALLGIGGANAARTLQRYERGERPCPLDLALAVERLTVGRVAPSSFQQARRDRTAAQNEPGSEIVGVGGALVHDGETAADGRSGHAISADPALRATP